MLIDVEAIASKERWLMEGVYSWIADNVALDATLISRSDNYLINECVERTPSVIMTT